MAGTAALDIADGVQIDLEVGQAIQKVNDLLKKKKAHIAEQRQNALKELHRKQQDLEKQKKRIKDEINKEQNRLDEQKKALRKYRSDFFESDRPPDHIVFINVGGKRIDTSQETLTSCKGSTLSAMFSLSQFPGLKEEGVQEVCFIDRNPVYFGMIVEFLRANTKPWFSSRWEEEAFRKETDYFGLTSWIFPPPTRDGKPVQPPIAQKTNDDGHKVYQVRFSPLEITAARKERDKKCGDGFFTSPDFLHTSKNEKSGDRWRLLFTERHGFLSVFLHNVDAGLTLANAESKTLTIHFTLVHVDELYVKDRSELRRRGEERSVTQKVEKHKFSRRHPDIGFNYFQLISQQSTGNQQSYPALRQAGFLHTVQPLKKDEQARDEIVFEIVIEDHDEDKGPGQLGLPPPHHGAHHDPRAGFGGGHDASPDARQPRGRLHADSASPSPPRRQ